MYVFKKKLLAYSFCGFAVKDNKIYKPKLEYTDIMA